VAAVRRSGDQAYGEPECLNTASAAAAAWRHEKFMIFLPIVVRELRVRTRKRATYWTRVGVAGAGVLFCAPLLWDLFRPAGAAMTGSYVFDSAVAAAFALACSACLLTANAIASERREGTLGLLFLTRVKAIDILLGKLGSVGLTSLCALMAFLPILMIPVLAGGVTGGEAIRKGLVLLATLFFSLAIGLFAACAWADDIKAARRALGIMALALFAPPLLSHSLRAAQPMNLVSPLAALMLAGDGNYRTGVAFYWGSLGSMVGVGSIMMALSGALLRRSIGQRDAESTAPRESGMASTPAEKASRDRFQHGRESPVEWLVRTQRGVKGTMWTASLIAVCCNVGLLASSRLFSLFRSGSLSYYVIIYVPSIIGALVWGSLFAWCASRFFAETRRSGELELLWTTPLKGAGLVLDQWRALRRMLLWPVLTLFVPPLLQYLWLVLSYATAGNAPTVYQSGTMLLVYAVTVLGSLIVVVLHTAALCWLGLWFGLTARTQATAIAWTVGWVVGGAYVVVFLSRALMMILLIPLWSPLGSTLALSYVAGSWFPALLEALFLLWLSFRAKRWLLAAMGGVEVASVAERYTAFKTTVKRLRHWTPDDAGRALRPPAAGTGT
jgi:ABC-type transport system involved in multi-copper enzyme maturation permease subunit